MQLLDDLRDALRTLRRRPGLSALAVLLLGLGIGANTVTFSVARVLLLRQLPFPDPDRLVALWKERAGTAAREGASWPNVEDWRKVRALAEVGAYQVSVGDVSSVSGGAAAGEAHIIRATREVLRMLGARAQHGRLFEQAEFGWPLEDDARRSPLPVVASARFAVRHFGEASQAVGRSLRIDGELCLVVGVLPGSFEVLRSAREEVFAPLRVWPGHASDRSMSYLEVMARLADGSNLDAAQRELTRFTLALASNHAEERQVSVRLEPLAETWFGQARPVLTLLLSAAALVLLTACINLAVLFLVRGIRRERDTTIRSALGATRLRLLRAWLLEAAVLGATGAVAGLLAAAWELSLLSAFSSSAGLRLPPLSMDGGVLAFAVLTALATVAVVGLVPAVASSRPDLAVALRAGGTSSTASKRGRRAATGLVVLETAMSALLLAGTASLLHDLRQLISASPGFDLQRVLVVSIGRPPAEGGGGSAPLFWAELLNRVRSLPGVSSAALTGSPPLAERSTPGNMTVRVALDDRDSMSGMAEFHDVTPGYLTTLGIPLRSGRLFVPADEGSPVTLVNETLARQRWGSVDRAGGVLLVGGRAMTVVGVVADVRQHGLRAARPALQVYRPFDPSVFRKWPRQYLVVRTADAGSTGRQVEAIVRSLDSDRALTMSRSLGELAWRDTAWERLTLTVVAAFALLSLLCAVIGAYAAMSHALSQRRRELAIRLAVGATTGTLRAVVLGGIAFPALVGAGIGALGLRLIPSLGAVVPVGLAVPGVVSYASLLLVPVCVLLSLLAPVWRATSGRDILAHVRCE